MHPDTNKPYSWHGNYSPLTVIHDDLPYIHQEQAERLVDELVAICERFGYQLKSKQKTSGDGPNEKSHRERSYEGTNWSRIFTGDPVDHDMLRDMAMSLMVGGLSDGCTYNILYARITTAQGVDEERRSKRLKELPDIIKSARAKMSKPELPLPWIITKEWDDVAPPDPEYTVPDRVPRHHVTLFSGEGAAGKSTIGLHLAAAHAYGGPWLNAMPIKGPAIFIDCEDGVSIIHRRLYAVAQYYGCKFKHLIEGGLHLLSLAGEDAVMATATRGNKVEPTPLYSKILQAASDIKPQTIVIASSANVYAGSEIDRAQVNQFVLGLLVKIAIAADGSVILISHPSLTGMNSGSGISGSTQWHNAVRGRMYLKGIKPDDGDEQPDSDLRVLEFKKNQYGPVTSTITLRWKDGMFLPDSSGSSLDNLARDARAEEVFIALMHRFNAENRPVSPNRSSTYAPVIFAGQPEAKDAGLTKKHLEEAMERLFQRKKIRHVTWGPPSKPRSSIVINEGST